MADFRHLIWGDVFRLMAPGTLSSRPCANVLAIALSEELDLASVPRGHPKMLSGGFVALNQSASTPWGENFLTCQATSTA